MEVSVDPEVVGWRVKITYTNINISTTLKSLQVTDSRHTNSRAYSHHTVVSDSCLTVASVVSLAESRLTVASDSRQPRRQSVLPLSSAYWGGRLGWCLHPGECPLDLSLPKRSKMRWRTWWQMSGDGDGGMKSQTLRRASCIQIFTGEMHFNGNLQDNRSRFQSGFWTFSFDSHLARLPSPTPP